MTAGEERHGPGGGAGLKVEGSRCIASGLCSLTAPDLFEQRADGTAAAKVASVPSGREDAAEEAMLECPSSAIEIGG